MSQILSALISLITAPYIARVLGVENLGVFSYTNSIANYFFVISMLGLNQYGIRTIAEVASDTDMKNKNFSSVFYFQILISGIALIGYMLYIKFFCKENIAVSTIQGILIFSSLFNIDWLLKGLEKFKFISIRNIIVNCLKILLIFCLVKSEFDLKVYALIMTVNILLSNLFSWVYIPKLIRFKKVKFNEIIRHLRPNLILFAPIAAMIVYRTMDKTMLGIFSDFTQSGYYYNADKVINIPLGMITSLSIVLMPRITILLKDGETKEAYNILKKSFRGTIFVAAAMSFGIAAVSREFTPVFFGPGYDECIILIIMLSPIFIIKSYTSIIRNQVLIPCNMDKIYAFTVVIGAIINFIVNMILIPELEAKGAVIGTLVAEIVVCALQIKAVSRKIKFWSIFKENFKFLVFGVIMFLSVRFIAGFLDDSLLSLLIEIFTGALVYLGINAVYFWRTGELEGLLKMILKIK